MEADQGEDSKTSSEETSLSDVVNEDFGHGQLYECMFCRRGFSTAQALGGHMNIHRRDRARMRQQTLPPNPNCRSNEDPMVTAFCPQIPSTHVNYIPPVVESPRNNHIYRLAHPSGSRYPQRSRGNDVLDMLNTQHLDSHNDDLGLRLGNLADPQRLWIGEQQNRQDEEDGDLDLELRLGHQP